jgi:two-component system cell cycle response regulator
MTDSDYITSPLPAPGPEEPTRARLRGPHEVPPEPSQLALIVYAGENLGSVVPLREGEMLFGRSMDCKVVVNDGEVSRHHARLRVTAGDPPTVMVEDLCSTNGTRLNEVALHGPHELRPGDRVGLGSHVYKLVVLDALERAFHQSLLEAGTRDALTGLANRGAIMRELKARFQLAQRYGRPMSLVLVDLDYFKGINDAHGHAAGDAVLRAFAEVATGQLREPDLAGRIGGEEFLILLPETDREGGVVVAERLRQAVEAARVDIAGTRLSFTCSLGVSEISKEDREPGEALARADAALYHAKEDGRNRLARG